MKEIIIFIILGYLLLCVICSILFPIWKKHLIKKYHGYSDLDGNLHLKI